MYVKDPHEVKYQFLINKRGSINLKHFNDPKTFIEYSNDMQDDYKNIDEYDIQKEHKVLIVFDDMIAEVPELFIRDRKLNISLVFITQSSFKVPKDVRLNTNHFFTTKIPNNREFQQTALN